LERNRGFILTGAMLSLGIGREGNYVVPPRKPRPDVSQESTFRTRSKA